jgi:hypothetical protein
MKPLRLTQAQVIAAIKQCGNTDETPCRVCLAILRHFAKQVRGTKRKTEGVL